MWETVVLPKLKQEFPHRHSLQHSFNIFGIPESVIDHHIRPTLSAIKIPRTVNVTHGILASQANISVKFRVDGPSWSQVQLLGARLKALFERRLGSRIFSEGDDELKHVVHRLFVQKHKKLAIAESCTGGWVAKMLTDVPGASTYLLESLVTYSNESKVSRLGVKRQTLLRYGAVSSQCAKEMALGLRKKTGADYTLSITGIAGPTGQTPQKPVGLVFIGVSTPQKTKVTKYIFDGDRPAIRLRASLTALDHLRKEILYVR